MASASRARESRPEEFAVEVACLDAEDVPPLTFADLPRLVGAGILRGVAFVRGRRHPAHRRPGLNWLLFAITTAHGEQNEDHIQVKMHG